MTIMAVFLCLIWLLVFWRITRDRKPHIAMVLLGMLASLLAVFLSASSLWQAASNGYPQDSFFTLKASGRIGVFIISSTCIALFFLFLSFKSRLILQRVSTNLTTRFFALIADCFIALGLFDVLYSLSPQIYYTFYRIIIPSLPNQIVVHSLFDLEKLWQIAILIPEDSLSNHLSGLVFLAIIPFTFWHHSLDKKWSKERGILAFLTLFILMFPKIM